jgi:uncharacterized membrane protein HdeD (DUF308 family)
MAAAGSGLPVRSIARESVGWSIGISVLLILAGLIALAAPLIAGVLVETIIAWLLIFGGIAHLVLAFHVRGAGAHLWEALVGVVYIAAGIFLLLHPLAGLVSLTLFLGAYLLIKGIFELIAGFTLRGVPGGGWLFLDAVISIILAAFIWLHLPYAAGWVVGTLLGVAILFSGISRLALALAARRSHAALLYPSRPLL